MTNHTLRSHHKQLTSLLSLYSQKKRTFLASTSFANARRARCALQCRRHLLQSPSHMHSLGLQLVGQGEVQKPSLRGRYSFLGRRETNTAAAQNSLRVSTCPECALSQNEASADGLRLTTSLTNL